MKREDKKSSYRHWDRPALAIVGLTLLGATLLPAARERRSEWRAYQREFRQLVTERYGPARAKQIPSGVQQIWIGGLQRADRCMTCHMGVTWKGFENAKQPFRTHPPEPLRDHPIERFGCSVCHGGQGHAIDLHGAHGEGHFWDEPLLGSSVARRYSLTGVNRDALIQIHCNACHRYDKETAGANAINLAKRTFAEQPCTDCHLLGGKGGTIGPDLTWVGDKHAEEFDFARVRGPRTAFAWHVAHFKNPDQVLPGTAMPDLGLTDEQAQSLAMLMLSWRKPNIPAEYRPELWRTMNGRAPQSTQSTSIQKQEK